MLFRSQENAEKVCRSKTSTHNQQEEEIERDCEKEREGSHVPIFSPLNFRIVRMIVGWMGFYFKVSALRVKRGLFLLNLIWAFFIEFGVL